MVLVEVPVSHVVGFVQGFGKQGYSGTSLVFRYNLLANVPQVIVASVGPAPVFTDDFEVVGGGSPHLFPGLQALARFELPAGVDDEPLADFTAVIGGLRARLGQFWRFWRKCPPSPPLAGTLVTVLSPVHGKLTISAPVDYHHPTTAILSAPPRKVKGIMAFPLCGKDAQKSIDSDE